MSIGVLSIHLDGNPCAVACPFCYLGARETPGAGLTSLRRAPRATRAAHPVDELEAAIARLEFAELAIAVSEPVDEAAVARLVDAGRRRSRPATITTTLEIARRHPALLRGVQRLNLSVDGWKIEGSAMDILAAVRDTACVAHASQPGLEVIALATLASPGFASLLVDEGLLASLVDLPELAGVALSALKPPPPFCDRGFWLRTLAVLRPLLDRALDRRLFLDCYVAARLLALGPCPGRADLSPDPRGGLAFRSCVYSARADLTVPETDALARAEPYVAPSTCPFDTRL